jgi:hypothetical protein
MGLALYICFAGLSLRNPVIVSSHSTAS